MNVLAELKCCNVIRIAGLYLIGAGLIVQVAGTFLPLSGATDWIRTSTAILLAIGFVPALMFAWIFESTAPGVRRAYEVETGRSIAPQTARSLDRVCEQHARGKPQLRSVPFFAGLRDDPRFSTWAKSVGVPE